MRPFEVASAIALIASALVWGTSVSRRMKAIFALLCILPLVLHIVIEGGHWQLLPLYLAFAILVRGLLKSKVSPSDVVARSSLILVLCLLSVGLSSLIPMFSLPKPTGSYPVGTHVMYLRDDSRTDSEGAEPKKGRELIVQVWYPATISSNHFATYRRSVDSKLKTSYQSVLWTNSRIDAPFASRGGPFPVIFFGHGWGGSRIVDTFLTEELASHGFVVVGIDHPYNSDRVAFPDGRVVYGIPDSPIINVGEASAEETEAIWNKELQRWTADQIFVLNSLHSFSLDRQSFWYDHLNTDLAGAIGHSFGGAAAIRASCVDPRVRAAINMDGWTFDGVRDRPLGKSVMWMYEEGPDPQSELLQASNQSERINAEMDVTDSNLVNDSLQQFGGYKLVVTGAAHGDFTDHSMVSPLRAISHSGPIQSSRMQMIVRTYVLAFFNKAIYGEDSSLLRAGNPSPFREVRLDSWPTK